MEDSRGEIQAYAPTQRDVQSIQDGSLAPQIPALRDAQAGLRSIFVRVNDNIEKQKMKIPNYDQMEPHMHEIFQQIRKVEGLNIGIIEKSKKDFQYAMESGNKQAATEVYTFLQDVYAKTYNAIADVLKMFFIYPQLQIDADLYNQFYDQSIEYLFEVERTFTMYPNRHQLGFIAAKERAVYQVAYERFFSEIISKVQQSNINEAGKATMIETVTHMQILETKQQFAQEMLHNAKFAVKIQRYLKLQT